MCTHTHTRLEHFGCGNQVGRHAAAVQSSSKAGQHPCSPELLAPGDVQAFDDKCVSYSCIPISYEKRGYMLDLQQPALIRIF
eukprot:scaffold14059_cov18-Tisochrysis_lutea.AAC.2